MIEGIAAAQEMIVALLKRSSGTVDLTSSMPARRPGRRRVCRAGGKRATLEDSKRVGARRGTKTARSSTRKTAGSATRARDEGFAGSQAPTTKMVTYAQSLARDEKATLPNGCQRDFDACRRFLDEHARQKLWPRERWEPAGPG